MKLTREYNNHYKLGEKTPQRWLVYHSACDRYHICRHPKTGMYHFIEVTPGNTWPIISSQHNRLGDAKAVVKAAERDRQKVWPYFVERAERDKAEAIRWARERFSTCGYMQNVYAQNVEKTVEMLTEDGYSYCKYRAMLRSSSSGWTNGQPVDPAALRDWEAMLSETYKQHWQKQVG